MKVLLLNCFLMLAFLSLIGCSQNQKSVNLQVSASFTVGAAGFTGGLIAYGEGPNGAKFAVSSGTGQSVNTTISDGNWKIYVMGWEGDAFGNKFVGLTQCGMSEVNLASTDTSVNITLAGTNCSGSTFATDVLPKNLLIASCGAFYKYNGGATNSFVAPDSDNFCSTLPTNLKTSFEYYRLTLPTIQGSNVSPGITSACINAKHDSTLRLNVPTQKFPFRVLMFRSKQDCMNPTNPRMSAFGFLNGLATGNQASFDHHYFPETGNTNARLFLPTSMTRRGYSPFMGMLPRILCGGSDCFAEPILPSFSASGATVTTQFNVPWSSEMFMSGNDDKNRDKTIIKGYKPTNFSSNTCDSPTLSLLNQSPYFSVDVDQCSIQNGDLRGSFARNALICRDASDFSSVTDLYERNGRIYHYDISDKKILVYSAKGVHLNTVDLNLTGSQTYKSMATDSANNLYVVILDPNVSGPNPRKLRKYTFSSGYTSITDWNSSDTGYAYLQNIEKIEVTDNGKIVAATSNSIQAFDLINAAGNVVNMNGSLPIIKKILFRNSKLYILTFESSYSELYAATLSGVTGLTLSSLGTSYFTGSSDPEYASFHYTDIADSKYFVFNPKGSSSDLKIYPITNLTAPYVTIPYTDSDIQNGGPIIMVKNMIYKKSGSNTFTARNFIPATTGATANVVGSTVGLCTAQLAQAVTPNSDAYALNLRSSSASTYDTIFDDAFRFIGRKVVPSEHFYYFKSLAESNKDNGANPGGILGRVEQMLGPDGVGGVLNGLYPDQDCGEIVNALPTTGSVTKTATLYDIVDGSTQTVSINLSKPGTGVGMMGAFACGGAGAPTDCAADLVVDVVMIGKSEKMRLKLDCDAKRGSMENREYKVSDYENRHLILWNTAASDAKYEQYTLEDRVESSKLITDASVTRLVKQPGTSSDTQWIEMRKLEINRNNTSLTIKGNANEFYRTDTNQFMSTAVNTGSISLYDWENDHNSSIGNDNINSVITSDKISSIKNTIGAYTHSSPGICMWSTNTSLQLPSTVPTCSVPSAHIIEDPSKKADVTSLEDLNGETTDANGAMASQFATEVFEIDQP